MVALAAPGRRSGRHAEARAAPARIAHDLSHAQPCSNLEYSPKSHTATSPEEASAQATRQHYPIALPTHRSPISARPVLSTYRLRTVCVQCTPRIICRYHSRRLPAATGMAARRKLACVYTLARPVLTSQAFPATPPRKPRTRSTLMKGRTDPSIRRVHHGFESEIDLVSHVTGRCRASCPRRTDTRALHATARRLVFSTAA